MTDHVIWMPDPYFPKQLLYSDVSAGQGAPEDQKKCFKDNIRIILQKIHKNSSNWEDVAQNRLAWGHSLHEGRRHIPWRRSPTGCQRKKKSWKEKKKSPPKRLSHIQKNSQTNSHAGSEEEPRKSIAQSSSGLFIFIARRWHCWVAFQIPFDSEQVSSDSSRDFFRYQFLKFFFFYF